VLSHDPTRGEVVIVEHEWSRLAEIEVTGGHPLGLLPDLIAQAGNLSLNIEIKNWPNEPDFDDSVEFAIEAAGYARDIDLVTCFHWPTMRDVRAARPSVRTGLLVDAGWDWRAARDEALTYGHEALALHHSLISDEPAAVMAPISGLAVLVWAVNDPELGIQLADANVYGVITDDPAAMVGALGEVPEVSPPPDEH